MHYTEILEYAVAQDVSDIHFVPSSKPTMRQNGQLFFHESAHVYTYDMLDELVVEIVPENMKELLVAHGECHFSYSIPKLGRFRIHAMKQRGTYCIAIRVLKESMQDYTALGLPKTLMSLMHRPKGLLLVTGPAGSGKSTTIAALIEYINQNELKKIMTIESPIEFLFQHEKATILQREVGSDCDSITDGIRSCLYHDPDIVVISSLNEEDIDLALKVAEAGKLVIAGFNTLNVRNTVSTLLNQSSSEARTFKLASQLVGVFSQQLVPHMNQTNRMLAYELLLPNAAFKQHVFDHEFDKIPKVIIAGRKEGMKYMDHSLYELYEADVIDKDTLYRFAHDLNYMQRLEITQVSAKQ